MGGRRGRGGAVSEGGREGRREGGREWVYLEKGGGRVAAAVGRAELVDFIQEEEWVRRP